MLSLKHLALGCALVCASGVLHAQEGSIDPTFNPMDIGHGNGDGANSTVYSSALQPDGRILIGGYFSGYNGTARNGIARLNADGSLDASFNPGAGASNWVNSTTLQSDGKILIGGDFTSYNGIVRNRIARLNADGSLDASFDPGTGANSTVRSITLQPDGKILIGGYFTLYNGTGRNYIARLNADGSLDASFNPSSGADNAVWSITRQPDGKVLVGGDFTSYSGTGRNRIARLNTDGSLDASFNPGSGANATVWSTTLQPDGRILIGGELTSYNGTARQRIARLNADGSLDASFDPGTGANTYVWSTALQTNGKILIGGNFTSYGGTGRNRIARLNADGSLDASFNPGTEANDAVASTALQPDGKILIGGTFTNYNGTWCNRFARLNADGSLDASFNPGTGANNTIYSTALQPDGKILIGGEFTSFNGSERVRIARLNADGSLDASFNSGTGANGTIWSTTLQPDGKILISGDFTSYNGTGRNRIARLNADGSLDASFTPGTGANSTVFSTDRQPDGKIIIGGIFTSYDGMGRIRIARLNTDGSLDASFNPGSGADSQLRSTALQPDGKILIGGYFSTYNGTGRNRIARLNSDGSLDASFNPGTAANNAVWSITLQPDGKILIGGQFTSYNGTGRNYVACLNTDGSLDASFNPGTGANGTVFSTDRQPDGKILIGGTFTSYNGAGRNYIARLNTDGSLDASFNSGSGANNTILSTTQQPDGKILIAGWLTSYNGTGRNRIARVNGTAHAGIRVMLEGPYSGGMMNDALRTLPSFPLTEPFTSMGYAETGFVPGATIPASLLTVTGNNAIVDWALVEMRPVATPGTVAATRAVLLQRDGDVVDLDGVSTVGFAGLTAGSYCVAVKPRNHLPVMLSTSTPIVFGDVVATVDFTLPGTQVYDNDARKNVGGVMVLAAGDVTFDETIKYINTGNDRDPILARIGGVVPTNTVTGYWREDVNMDGTVKYIGSANDRDIILQNIGGVVPTNTRVATLP